MQVCEKPIRSLGMEFASTEQAYQANKFTDPAKRLAIQQASHPTRAKTMVRDWPVETPDWHNHRLDVMWDICCQKWTQPRHMGILLSHQEPIVEFVNWNDKFYGVVITPEGQVKGGENFLGRIIGEIRERVLHQKTFEKPDWLVAPPLPVAPPSDQLSLF